MRIEHITWRDSTSTSDWMQRKDFNKDSMGISSIGFLLKEDKETVTLVMNAAEDGQISMTMCIPKAVIVHRQRIKV